jgi:hypothetical protein
MAREVLQAVRLCGSFFKSASKNAHHFSSFRSMRRRHGIPDNDHRPFNVAYAAAVRARQDREAANRKAKLPDMAPGQDQRNALPEQNLRQRIGMSRVFTVACSVSYLCFVIVGAQRNLQTAWPNGTIDNLPTGSNPSADDVLGLSNALTRFVGMPIFSPVYALMHRQ